MEWTAETYRAVALTWSVAAQELAVSGVTTRNSADVFLLCGIAAEAFLRSWSPDPNTHRSDHRLNFWIEEAGLFVGGSEPSESDVSRSVAYLARSWRSSDRFLGTDDLRKEVKRRTGLRSRAGERLRSDPLIEAARLALTAVRQLTLYTRP